MAILGVVLCLASGLLVVAAAWPTQRISLASLLIKLALSIGFGLGIFSVVFFVARLVGTTHLFVVDVCSIVLLLFLLALSRVQPMPTALPSETADINTASWLRAVLSAAFVLAVLGAVYTARLRVMAYPHGDGWDAFAIWNLHARFLFLGGSHWRDGFSALIPWSHPDYPLLLPGAIAHFWSYLGHDDPRIPALIGFAFTIAVLALLFSSLVLLRGRNAAMLAGLALSSTPFFVEQGTSQYADVALSFFILASLVLLHFAWHDGAAGASRSGLLVLSGLSAGFAGWTKNEGLLFFCALVLAQLWISLRARGPDTISGGPVAHRRSLIPFALGAAPVLLVILWFKHSVAGPGDLFSSPSAMADLILSPRRYWIIFQWFAKEILRFGNWWIVPGTIAMLAFYLLIRHKEARPRASVSTASLMALSLTLAGYFLVYVITPRDLYWHLRFSLNRLFLQLWPSIIFVFFQFAGNQMSAAPKLS